MTQKKLIFFFLLFLGTYSVSIAQPASVCPPNIDFELGTTGFWNYYIGSCCPIVTPTSTPPLPSRHALTSGAGLDYYGGFPIVSPGGGSFSMKLGNDTGGHNAEKARYYVHVPTGVANYSLIYRYAVVIEDPMPEHAEADQPRFEVSAIDSATGLPIPCAAYSYVATASLPGFTPSPVTSTLGSNGLDVIYKPWATASINLSGLGGTTLAIDFASGDCALGGHFGYGYLDMTCGLFQISGVSCDDTATHITLSAPSGYEFYSWYDSSTFSPLLGSTQTITLPMPGTATTYAVVLTPYPLYGCPDTLYTRISPTHLQLHPMNDTMVCSAAGITLDVAATDVSLPLTYNWIPATGLSCTSCANPVASPPGTTTYTVTVTDAAGCTKTASVRITIDPIAGAVTKVDDTCFGYNNGSAHINMTGGAPPFAYAWTTTPPQTASTATGLYAGTYTVTVTDNLGCVINVPTTIIDGPVTVLTLIGTSNPTTCLGNEGTITLGGLIPGGTFIVSYVFGGATYTQSLVADGAGHVTLVGLRQGAYNTIGIITSHCPYNTIGPVILADPLPPVIGYIGSNSPVCLTSALNLFVTTTPGVTYDWRGPLVFSSTFQNPVIAPAGFLNGGWYTCTIQLNNCFAKDSTFVVIKPLPLPTASSNTPICSGDTLKLYSSSSNGASSYVWNGPDAFYAPTQNPHINSAQATASGTYTVTVTLNGCTVIDSTRVVVNQTPGAPATTDTEYCQKDAAAVLTAAGTNLIWYTQPIGGSGTIVPPIPSTLIDGIQKWYVSQTSAAGCEGPRGVVTVQTDYLATPYIAIEDTVICNGNTFVFWAKGTGDDMTSLIWAFEKGDSMTNINPIRYAFPGPGTYTVTATARYKVCPIKSTTRTLNVFNAPSVNIGEDTALCAGSAPLVLRDEINKNTAGTTWAWSTGETSSSIIVREAGTYFIKVYQNGCSSTDTIIVKNDCYMNVPNVFTPNGDGMNDYFFPRTSLTKGLTSFKLDIFNRWGQLIFSTSAIDGMGWDGRFNDEPQPQGVFVYVIDATFKDGQKEHHQGNVTLIR